MAVSMSGEQLPFLEEDHLAACPEESFEELSVI
jgi:hypothetical protein